MRVLPASCKSAVDLMGVGGEDGFLVRLVFRCFGFSISLRKDLARGVLALLANSFSMRSIRCALRRISPLLFRLVTEGGL